MPNLPPTKGNLTAAKRSRVLAVNGFTLMDKKRNILIRELMALIDEAESLQSRIESTFTKAYSALSMASISLGGCEDIANAVPLDNSLGLRYRSVMGVELPTLTSQETDMETMPYGFSGTSSALDEAYIEFQKVKQLTKELAQTENSIFRLAYSIRKAQKRANALKNIVLPNLDSTISRITDSLEEKEREEFIRMKVIKRQKA